MCLERKADLILAGDTMDSARPDNDSVRVLPERPRLPSADPRESLWGPGQAGAQGGRC